MTSETPPGWYPDPARPDVQWWWNGVEYTESRPLAAAPVVAVYRRPGASPKSRLVATILGFFLGGIGVDRFYLGNVGMGVAKLLVGWLTLGIWPLIDWIIIIAGAAHDGDGLPVTEWS